MAQIRRIQDMESILDEGTETIGTLARALDRYEALLPRLQILEDYYTGGQWMQDYEEDREKRLPPDLKRGVLSEDAVFDLLQDQTQMLQRMREMVKRAWEKGE